MAHDSLTLTVDGVEYRLHSIYAKDDAQMKAHVARLLQGYSKNDLRYYERSVSVSETFLFGKDVTVVVVYLRKGARRKRK